MSCSANLLAGSLAMAEKTSLCQRNSPVHLSVRSRRITIKISIKLGLLHPPPCLSQKAFAHFLLLEDFVFFVLLGPSGLGGADIMTRLESLYMESHRCRPPTPKSVGAKPVLSLSPRGHSLPKRMTSPCTAEAISYF